MLGNIKFKAIEDLKMTRADGTDAYDVDGEFVPYSTTINTESEHEALMSEQEVAYRKTLPYDAMGDYSFMSKKKKKSMSWPSDFDGAHHVAIKQSDDDMNYQEAYNPTKERAKENPELVTALNNVLTLASERADQFESNALKNRDSIKVIKKFLYECQTRKDG